MSVSRLGALTLGQICVGRARRCACRAKKKCRQATTARPFRREIRGVREEVRRNIKVGGVRSRWGRSVTPSFASGKRKCCLRDSGFGALDAAGQVHPWRGQVHQCGGQVHERVGQGQDRAGQVPPVKRLLARAARRPSGARGQGGGRAAVAVRRLAVLQTRCRSAAGRARARPRARVPGPSLCRRCSSPARRRALAGDRRRQRHLGDTWRDDRRARRGPAVPEPHPVALPDSSTSRACARARGREEAPYRSYSREAGAGLCPSMRAARPLRR